MKNFPAKLPPHLNAEVHEKIMEGLRAMSSEEFFQTVVDAGIYTPDGKLTEKYAPSDSDQRLSKIYTINLTGRELQALQTGLAKTEYQGGWSEEPLGFIEALIEKIEKILR